MRRPVFLSNLLLILLLAVFVLASCGKEKEPEDMTSKEVQESFEKGNAYYKLGRIDEAIKAYEETVLYDRTHKMAHYNLAVLYAEKGRNAEAIHEFEEYIKYETDTDEGTKEVINYVTKEIKKLKEKGK